MKNCIRVSEMITNEDMKTISIQLNRGLLKYYLSPDDLYFLDEETQKGLLKTLTNNWRDSTSIYKH